VIFVPCIILIHLHPAGTHGQPCVTHFVSLLLPDRVEVEIVRARGSGSRADVAQLGIVLGHVVEVAVDGGHVVCQVLHSVALQHPLREVQRRVEVAPLVLVCHKVAMIRLQSKGCQLETLILVVEMVVLQDILLELQVVLVACHLLSE